MNNKSSNSIKNMIMGITIGASVASAGAVYLAQNKEKAKNAINNMKVNADRIADAGEEIVEDINMKIKKDE